ncbi:MAG TPA: glycine--tRNA ligase subunit alpha/beta, partial [Anaerolineae bacterium]|nr:glycine--tRNA ligase subunit alpha/beta [Anaerolineae bacterium]
AAARLQPVPVPDDVLAEVMDFIAKRLYVALRDEGYPHDVVEAVLAEQAWNPARALDAVATLAEAVQQPWWEDVFTAYARAKRIVRNLDATYDLNPDAYVEPATRELHAAYEAAAAKLAANRHIAVLVQILRDLQAPINNFFENVLVMAEDPTLRAARLALVQRIAALPDGLADLTKLRGF